MSEQKIKQTGETAAELMRTKLLSYLREYQGKQLRLMEVCGTHTVSYTHLIVCMNIIKRWIL